MGNQPSEQTLTQATQFAFPNDNIFTELFAALHGVAQILTTDVGRSPTYSFEQDPAAATLTATIESTDWKNLGEGYPAKIAIKYWLENGGLVATPTVYETYYGDTPGKKEVALYTFEDNELLPTIPQAVQDFVEKSAGMMSVATKEKIGKNPLLQKEVDSPYGHILRPFFPNVTCGIEQLEAAFQKLNAILQTHTSGLVEVGIGYAHRGFHEFWVGYNFQKLKETKADALFAEHDRKGWSITGRITRKEHTYGVDENLYAFDESDYTKDSADPRACRSHGWIPMTPADIFGKAVEYAEYLLVDGLSDAAQLEILAIMEEFPANPSPDQPVVATAPAPTR